MRRPRRSASRTGPNSVTQPCSWRRVVFLVASTFRAGLFQAIERSDAALAVRTSAGTFEADAVCVGIGLIPETALAASAGCEVDGGVVVDNQQRTNVPGIWAAGDCALYHSPIRGRRGRLES